MPLPTNGDKPRARPLPWRRFVPLLVVLAGLAVGYAMGWHHYLSLSYLMESRAMLTGMVEARPLAAMVVFGAIYALAVAFAFPAASVLTVFAGFLFGWLAGAAVVAVAATTGATALFLVARTAFGDGLRSRFATRFASLAEGFENNAFGYLLALRIAPIFPFFAMNIAPAMFKVPVATFVGATLLGILPGTLAYTYLGQGVDSVLVAAERAGGEPALSDLVTPQITAAFVLLALVAAIPPIFRTWRQRRKER